MNVVIKPKVFDPEGNFRAAIEWVDMGEVTRRLSRRATIDGGTWIDDFGSSAGDRVFEIGVKSSESVFKRLKRVQQFYNEVDLIVPEGVFSGAIAAVRVADFVYFTFMVKEQISE